MTKNAMKTKVIFRKWSDGTVIALLPEIAATNNPYHCQSYEHVGQHGAADPGLVVLRTRLAKPLEYRALAGELRKCGYRLNIGSRINRTASLAARRNQLQ